MTKTTILPNDIECKTVIEFRKRFNHCHHTHKIAQPNVPTTTLNQTSAEDWNHTTCNSTLHQLCSNKSIVFSIWLRFLSSNRPFIIIIIHVVSCTNIFFPRSHISYWTYLHLIHSRLFPVVLLHLIFQKFGPRFNKRIVVSSIPKINGW